MINKAEHVKLWDNVYITVINDPKFKTNNWEIKFIIKMSEVNNSAAAIISDCFSSANKKYDTIEKMSEKLCELYGANLFSSVARSGDNMVVSLGSSSISDLCALYGEHITEEVLDILLDCIFNPCVKDGKVDEKIFALRKRDVIDTIRTEINEKRRYLILKGFETTFENEPAGKPVYGTLEQAEKVTPEIAYNEWQKILKYSRVEIFYTGSENVDSYIEKIKNSFKNCCTEPVCGDNVTPPIYKKELRKVTETLDVNQSKFFISMKTDVENKYQMRMMSLILGGTPQSKLFMNVREKDSLCYYCQSTYLFQKHTLIIDCGVEKDNIKKAYDAILEQIDEIKNGNVSDIEIAQALLVYKTALHSVGDTPDSCINWYMSCYEYGGEFNTPEVSMQRYLDVTKEDIINAAKSLKPDTLYILEQK